MKRIETDVLVIGSGLAGLFYALKCAQSGARVTVATKKSVSKAATALAQGGVAVCIRRPDTISSHIRDTLRTGKGLSKKPVVEFVMRSGAGAIRDLESIGVRFDRTKKGVLELGREGGHSFRRIVHVKDETGKAIEKALVRSVKAQPLIRIIENAYAVDIDVRTRKKRKETAGAWFYKDPGKKEIRGKTQEERLKDKSVFYCSAHAVAIATGGLCALYKSTVNPDISTGDGMVMAYRAGCALRDLEFIQFHPTALRKGKSPFFLISEAVRGEGARLVTRTRIPIMKGFKRKDLEARDVVSRQIFKVMKKEEVYLDFTRKKKSFIRKRFSGIFKECMKRGLDISRELVPITPAAHYACGGIRANRYGETDVHGLFAVGEASSIGLHGANRLASNSLLESVVIARAASEKTSVFLRGKAKEKLLASGKKINVYELKGRDAVIQAIRNRIRSVLWEKAGIIRTRHGLKQGLKELRLLEKKLFSLKRKGFNFSLHQVSSQIILASIIIQSALQRKESRGCHFVEDFPSSSSKARHTDISKYSG